MKKLQYTHKNAINIEFISEANSPNNGRRKKIKSTDYPENFF